MPEWIDTETGEVLDAGVLWLRWIMPGRARLSRFVRWTPRR